MARDDSRSCSRSAFTPGELRRLLYSGKRGKILGAPTVLRSSSRTPKGGTKCRRIRIRRHRSPMRRTTSRAICGDRTPRNERSRTTWLAGHSASREPQGSLGVCGDELGRKELVGKEVVDRADQALCGFLLFGLGVGQALRESRE